MSKIDNSTTSIDTFYIEDVYSNSSYSESNKIRNSKKNSIEKIKKLQGIQVGFKKIYTHIKYLVSNIINDVLKPKNETINQKKEKLKYCIESLISSIHETISSFEEDIRPLFKLYIQEYKNGVPSYDIGNGSSDNEDSEFGNLNNLYPKRFDLYEIKNIYLDESINNLSSTMFYIPCFMILYDIEKIQLKQEDMRNRLINLKKMDIFSTEIFPLLSKGLCGSCSRVYDLGNGHFVSKRCQKD